MDEVIEQAAVAVAAVLDQPAWAFGESDLIAGLQGLEDVVTLARSAQASMVHEFAARGSDLCGATSVAMFVRDRLRVSARAGKRMVALGQVLDARPVLRAAMLRGTRPPAVAAIMAANFATSRASDAAASEDSGADGPPAEASSEVAGSGPGDRGVADAETADRGATGPEAADRGAADADAGASGVDAPSHMPRADSSATVAPKAIASTPSGEPAADGEPAHAADNDPTAADPTAGASKTLTGPLPADLVDPMGIAVNTEQALIIGAAIADLPHDLNPALVDLCETELIKLAALYEPAVLRRFGERILDHIAPDIAEAALAAKLDRDEATARRKRILTITDDGHGSHRIFGRLDTESAAIVKAAIDPLCKPIPGQNGQRDPRTADQRRADALIDICRLALKTDTLPDNGGMRPQLNVTTRFDVLTKELSTGSLDIGGDLSPTAVRRLACDALILPAVLGTRGEALDLGQQRRLFTGAVRRAIILRDGGCAFPGCDRPPRWCDVHHFLSWIKGGPTSECNGLLLCDFHHRTVHEIGGWRIIRDTDGLFSFIPPAHIDPQQRPQRNIYHRKR